MTDNLKMWIISDAQADERCKQFAAQYPGVYVQHNDLALTGIARRYHEDCEAYDRTVCTGMHNGVARPQTGPEYRLIAQHAHSRRRQAETEAAAHGLGAKALHKAIRDVAHDMR